MKLSSVFASSILCAAFGKAAAVSLSGGATAGPDQINHMISQAITSCERFYPAFQLVAWADRTPLDAMGIAMAEAYGRA